MGNISRISCMYLNLKCDKAYYNIFYLKIVLEFIYNCLWEKAKFHSRTYNLASISDPYLSYGKDSTSALMWTEKVKITDWHSNGTIKESAALVLQQFQQNYGCGSRVKNKLSRVFTYAYLYICRMDAYCITRISLYFIIP